MSDPYGRAYDTPVSNGKARRLFLFGLLGVVLIALGYDYLVARPSVDAAYNLIAEADATSAETLTNEDVSDLLGKEPVHTFTDGNQTVEVYYFTSGVLVKPHKLYTAYQKDGDQLLFYRHAKYVYDKAKETPREGVEIVREDASASASESVLGDGVAMKPADDSAAESNASGEEATDRTSTSEVESVPELQIESESPD
ncbi:hypothetical protein FYK55_23940 [Roseiconus nitratireducens]|uniref:Uncharacterized protein n=1 Tax=Roseiconus nitratireducens TaxID=2605748 RepID=A0A5M6CWM4_9BACT|nr:hypothetical protein [Roseiconus nitratireducens]KAA5539621.1 hypothetical protein FYK55_23940 [Roseiconus nitratireducens]